MQRLTPSTSRRKQTPRTTQSKQSKSIIKVAKRTITKSTIKKNHNTTLKSTLKPSFTSLSTPTFTSTSHQSTLSQSTFRSTINITHTTHPLSTPLRSFARYNNSMPDQTNVFQPNASKYLNWVNAPESSTWRQVVDIFLEQGYKVKADQDPAAPSFYRLKFEDNNTCRQAFERLNGFTAPNQKAPFDLRFGRSFRTEGTTDDLIAGRLEVIQGPTNLAWTVIKDAIQQYVPVLSVDQVAPSVYKLRFFTRKDYDYVYESLVKTRVPTPIGQDIVFLMRPWKVWGQQQTSAAQQALEAEYQARHGDIALKEPKAYKEGHFHDQILPNNGGNNNKSFGKGDNKM